VLADGFCDATRLSSEDVPVSTSLPKEYSNPLSDKADIAAEEESPDRSGTKTIPFADA
jgi:hypothetical protein